MDGSQHGRVMAAQARQMRRPTCLVLCSDSRFSGAFATLQGLMSKRHPAELGQQPSSREFVPWRRRRLACQVFRLCRDRRPVTRLLVCPSNVAGAMGSVLTTLPSRQRMKL
ncbi:hypothetical protein CDD81_8157 [Ophiocordyceps australis]|uniref:Uncharacterized protein n=1 Tax=Ophiocordyceps australis TaxID=1399860 RepID=A0A2C5Y1M8_9HYPO|nr:hypothetical protein CDD81_8157 [Ophiocordyceps australis]